MIIFENILVDVFYGVKESVNIITSSPRKKKQPHPTSKSPVKPLTGQGTQASINTPNSRPQHQSHSTPVKHAFVEAGISVMVSKQAVSLGYEPGPAWSQKVIQLYTITQVKHGESIRMYKICMYVASF